MAVTERAKIATVRDHLLEGRDLVRRVGDEAECLGAIRSQDAGLSDLEDSGRQATRARRRRVTLQTLPNLLLAEPRAAVDLARETAEPCRLFGPIQVPCQGCDSLSVLIDVIVTKRAPLGGDCSLKARQRPFDR